MALITLSVFLAAIGAAEGGKYLEATGSMLGYLKSVASAATEASTLCAINLGPETTEAVAESFPGPVLVWRTEPANVSRTSENFQHKYALTE